MQMPSSLSPHRRSYRRYPGSSLAARHGVTGAVFRCLQRSHAADYICLVAAFATWYLIQLFATPVYHVFSLDNPSIQYPFAEKERVPVWWSTAYGGILPLAIIVVWSIVFHPSYQFLHASLLGFLTCVGMTSLVTDIIKNAVGRPRPDLLSRCMPELGTPEHALVTFKVCTNTNQHRLEEGWRSFPSGHSSFSFAGLGFLSLFLAGQTSALRLRINTARLLFSTWPLIGAFLIAASRLADYRHDIYDVTCGSLLGCSVAYLAYRRYFPSLKAANCDIPHDMCGEKDFARIPDDEEQAFFDSSHSNGGQAGPEEAYPLRPSPDRTA